MFASKAGAYPNGAHLGAKVGLLAVPHKYKPRLEKFSRDKLSSLLWKFESYSCKKFYETGIPGPNVIKLFKSVIYECS
jgi:hypothetical protein